MNLYVLMHESFAPRYRVPQFVPFLKKRGVETDLTRLPRGILGRWVRLARARKYDTVVLERKLIQPWELDFLRKRSRRLIFDFDDAIMYRSSRWSNPHSSIRMAKFKRVVKSCDLVLAGNDFLREQALEFTTEDRAVVIPTVVDLARYPMRPEGRRKGNLTIGWIGSGGTIHYVEKILPALDEVARRFPHVCLKIVCNRFLKPQSIKIIRKPWAEDQEVEDLHSFDIGIMPLTDDLWARGKCGLKLVQYSAVGIPVVCSPVGVNRDIVRDGLSGYWAATKTEWIEALGLLIKDPGLRQKMGLTGRQIVAERYSLEAVGQRLVPLLRGF